MKQPPLDIEQVVREVIAELERAAHAAGDQRRIGTTATAAGTGAQAGEQPARGTQALAANTSPGASDELVVSTRVVTMAQLDGRLAAIRRLVVPPQAVVTPAVRDELLRKNISLIYATGTPVKAAGTLRLRLLAVGGRFDPGPLALALRSEGLEVQAATLDCLIAATEQVAAELSAPDTVALLLTPHTAAAVCLANRHRGVRAAWAVDVLLAAAAVTAIGANLLVADPTALGFVQLKRMASEFCRGEARECPAVFRNRLA